MSNEQSQDAFGELERLLAGRFRNPSTPSTSSLQLDSLSLHERALDGIRSDVSRLENRVEELFRGKSQEEELFKQVVSALSQLRTEMRELKAKITDMSLLSQEATLVNPRPSSSRQGEMASAGSAEENSLYVVERESPYTLQPKAKAKATNMPFSSQEATLVNPRPSSSRSEDEMPPAGASHAEQSPLHTTEQESHKSEPEAPTSSSSLPTPPHSATPELPASISLNRGPASIRNFMNNATAEVRSPAPMIYNEPIEQQPRPDPVFGRFAARQEIGADPPPYSQEPPSGLSRSQLTASLFRTNTLLNPEDPQDPQITAPRGSFVQHIGCLQHEEVDRAYCRDPRAFRQEFSQMLALYAKDGISDDNIKRLNSFLNRSSIEALWMPSYSKTLKRTSTSSLPRETRDEGLPAERVMPHVATLCQRTPGAAILWTLAEIGSYYGIGIPEEDAATPHGGIGHWFIPKGEISTRPHHKYVPTIGCLPLVEVDEAYRRNILAFRKYIMLMLAPLLQWGKTEYEKSKFLFEQFVQKNKLRADWYSVNPLSQEDWFTRHVGKRNEEKSLAPVMVVKNLMEIHTQFDPQALFGWTIVEIARRYGIDWKDA